MAEARAVRRWRGGGDSTGVRNRRLRAGRSDRRDPRRRGPPARPARWEAIIDRPRHPARSRVECRRTLRMRPAEARRTRVAVAGIVAPGDHSMPDLLQENRSSFSRAQYRALLDVAEAIAVHRDVNNLFADL